MIFRYWELDGCETVRPVAVEQSLPSDSRYRDDAIALGMGDLKRAQM
jgi:hypothetical protein